MVKFVQSLLSELKQKSFAELSQLAPYHGEKLKRDGKTFTRSVWKDMVNEAEVRIVVQVYRHLFWGIGRMAADGFRIDREGEIRQLSKRELYEFT